MSDEQTGTGGTDTDAQSEQTHASESSPTEGSSAESSASEGSASEGSASEGSASEGSATEGSATEAGDVKVKEAPQAAFAATVLGDTLPSAVRVALASGGHGHAAGGHGDGHGHDAHGDEHFAHTLPMKILGGVLGALIVLTVLTVAVTSVDLGSQGNFIVAMIIATIKAALVMGYFMHLVWDSKFNALVFLSSFLFVLLFLSMALLDRSEYQSGIDHFEADQKMAK